MNEDIIDKLRSKIQMEKYGRNIRIESIRHVAESNKELQTHRRNTVGRPRRKTCERKE
jgi:urease beta subunit